MKKIMDYLNDFNLEFDWKDILLFKLCMIAFGVMLGLSISRDKKDCVRSLACTTVVTTAILLIKRFCGCCLCCEEEDLDAEDFADEDEEAGFVMKITAEE